ncbi:hypothetical protein [Pseudoduganella namucuonensis]|uniref:site-specific DNA-methyltransferase (cytosine-N(4)-specific) n=1 Tax=Pseudoduganella namucuonensis TaxID=1035707 RepID=A0A1I7M0D8_9BURK|nr:hypothetical protein [Pseudoduganella namucuonensis]SFV15432.1 DNA methylase [Pseudoduganella namucuonensis]
MIRSIHPFPARMAPELALGPLHDLPEGSVVLDPMSGSGTVVRQAAQMGHSSIGVDMDPLAVLMSRVWTTPIDDEVIEKVSQSLIKEALELDGSKIELPWIDHDAETKEFVDFWFGMEQQADLRKLAFVLHQFDKRKFSRLKHAAADVVRVALSRIIVTKEQGASLARDTSHSRPHKVAEKSDFNVMDGLSRSLTQVRNRLIENPPVGNTRIILGDARSLKQVGSESVDAVLTSPPYLNAIDYLRGHRMSLVWLGHQLGDLRSIRSNSIGAERAPNKPLTQSKFEQIQRAMCADHDLPKRYVSMIERYSEDVYRMVAQISRVTRIGGHATFVVGNSCLKGTFIQNSAGVAAAATMLGLREINTFERELPTKSRYLPITGESALGKRMRTETILTFGKI